MKKIIALLLVLFAMTFSFVSCDEPEEEKTDSSTETGVPGLNDGAAFEGPLVPIEPD